MKKSMSIFLTLLITLSIFLNCLKLNHSANASPELLATIDFDTYLLNLKSTGRWITTYIELPISKDYRIVDANVSTIIVNNTVPAELTPTAIGDYDNDTIPDLMVKFNRTILIQYLLSQSISFANVTLTLTGELYDNTIFVGNATIAVSALLGDANCDGKVNIYDMALATASYYSKEEELNWNSNVNFAPPWDTINIYDLVTMLYYYE